MKSSGSLVLSVLTVALLSGCGQVAVFGHVVGEKPQTESRPAPETPTSGNSNGSPATASPAKGALQSLQLVKALKISVAPKATENVASDATFSPDALVAAVRAELASRNLLAAPTSPTAATLEIQVSQVVLRPSTNAVVFGYKMMASTLIADLTMAGSEEKAATPFHLSAEARLTISARNDDNDPDQSKKRDPLTPLYRRFAVLTADRIAGVESEPDPDTSGNIQRF
jgi:hypothetical protein